MPTSSPTESAARKRCFAPVVDERTRVLILGSLPGDASLAVQEYYGNRQNKFWALMSDVLGVDLVALDYPARLRTLLAHRVGLWDVVAEAERKGSLDSGIRNHSGNDLSTLAESLPDLTMIAFNGGTASRLGRRQLEVRANRYRLLDLPSSSPAYTLHYAKKHASWTLLRDALL